MTMGLKSKGNTGGRSEGDGSKVGITLVMARAEKRSDR
jgi:hypothetical protein